MRGQAALEYVMILALVLAALLPLVYVTYSEFSTRNSMALMQLTAERLDDAVAFVVGQGPGAKTRVEAYMPSNVAEARVGGREIFFRVQSALGASTEVYRVAPVNVTPNFFPTAEGVYVFDIEYLPNGNVSVSLT